MMKDPFSTQVSQIQPLIAYLRKQRDNERFIRTTEISVTFISIAFFLFFAIRPTVLTISSLIGDIESKKLMKQELRVKINNVITAQDLFSQVQEKYNIVDSSLPDRPKFYDANNQIQKTSFDYNIPIDSLKFNLTPNSKVPLSDTNLKTYSIGMNIDGQFTNALSLITDLLKNRRLINIESFNINLSTDNKASPSAGQIGGLTTNFTTTYYYWPESYGKK